MMPGETKDYENTTIEDLEQIMQQCHHGGPTEEDQQSAWFTAANLFLKTRTPLLEDLHEESSLDQIWDALQEIEQIIFSNTTFKFMRITNKSARFFGALAVDAYINNDIPFVQVFLIKAYLLNYIQHGKLGIGPEMSSVERKEQIDFLVRDVQKILRQYNLDYHLTHMTRNSCQCVELAKALNEERESESAKQERLKLEVEQLPPLLKVDSKLFQLKRKAAQHLKAGRYEPSLKIYKEAVNLLERETGQAIKESLQNVRKLSEESGRVQCNISLLYMKMNDADQALAHAESAAFHFPDWSKPHCRRALALEELGRLEQAESAIFKALDYVENEVDCDSAAASIKLEYLSIQQRIQRNLASMDGDYMMSVGGDSTEDEVCEIEMKRRQAFCEFLLKNTSNHQLQQCCETYCNHKMDDPRGALNDFLRSSLSLVPSHETKTIPSWLNLMVSHGSISERKRIEIFCMEEGPDWLRKLIHYQIRNRLSQMVNFGFDDRHEVEQTYQNDIDGHAMRLLTWCPQDEDENEIFLEAGQMAAIFLNNLIVRKCQQEQKKLRDHGVATPRREHGLVNPVVQKMQKLTCLYIICLPSRLWPCEKELEYNWNYTAEDVDTFWRDNHPQVFRRWKSAFNELLRWVEDASGYEEQILLLLQGISLKENLRGRLTLNVHTVGIFFLKACIEHNGAASLKGSLNCQRDYSELVADCYSYFRLFKTMCPKLLEFLDSNIARSTMMSLGHN